MKPINIRSIIIFLMLPIFCHENTYAMTDAVKDLSTQDTYELSLDDVVIGNRGMLNSLVWPTPVLYGDSDNDGLNEGVCFWLDSRDNRGMCLIAEFVKGDSYCSGGDEIILCPIDNLNSGDITLKVETHDFDSDGIMEYIIFVIDNLDYGTQFFVIKTNGHGISPCESRLKNFFELVGSGTAFEPYIHNNTISGRKAFTGYSYNEWIYINGRLRKLSD